MKVSFDRRITFWFRQIGSDQFLVSDHELSDDEIYQMLEGYIPTYAIESADNGSTKHTFSET